MNNALKDISLSARRNTGNRVTLNRVTASRKTNLANSLPRLPCDMGQLEDGATHARVLFKYRDEQRASASTHINDPLKTAKGIGLKERGINTARHLAHGLVKDVRIFGVRGQIGELVGAKNLLEANLTGAD